MTKLQHFIASAHPAADGHFPGDPIIPGAVLLSVTLQLIEAELGTSLDPGYLKMAKFPASARPGDRLQIEFSGALEAGLRFSAAAGGITVLVGVIARMPNR